MADIDMPDASSSASAKPRASGLTKAVKSPSAADNGSDGKKRFEVKKVSYVCSPQTCDDADDHLQWNAVALWAWDIVVDNCAICRNHIMDLCMNGPFERGKV